MARALITDLAGPRLTEDERRFLGECDPLGVILFERNVESPGQLADLVGEVRAALGRDGAPVAIDQEGGRVARLREPHWWSGVPAARLGRAGPEACRLAARLLARDMAAAAIDVACAPCLDLHLEDMHDVIGDRAFAGDAATVAACGRAFCEGLLEGGVQPMIKHLPGHGRVTADPHRTLPVVDAGLAVLRAQDFIPFRALADMAWGMSAHVVFTAVDARCPATQSPAVIGGVIRRELGFDGVLVSDAIDMDALSGSHERRARLALAAGCDVVMHCNQALERRIAVARTVPELTGEAGRRVAAAAARWAPAAAGFDPAAARARLDQLLARR